MKHGWRLEEEKNTEMLVSSWNLKGKKEDLYKKEEKSFKNGGVFKKSEAEKNIEALFKITSGKNIETNYKNSGVFQKS